MANKACNHGTIREVTVNEVSWFECMFCRAIVELPSLTKQLMDFYSHDVK